MLNAAPSQSLHGYRLHLLDGRAAYEDAGFSQADLAACLRIRTAVFVEEQRVPVAEEMDGRDNEALHLLLHRDGAPIATARLLFEGDLVHIGRVAVLQPHRGTGAGRALMAAIPALLPPEITLLVLNAQSYAIGFYERLGYAMEGEEFMEAGIPHVAMTRGQ